MIELWFAFRLGTSILAHSIPRKRSAGKLTRRALGCTSMAPLVSGLQQRRNAHTSWTASATQIRGRLTDISGSMFLTILAWHLCAKPKACETRWLFPAHISISAISGIRVYGLLRLPVAPVV